MARRRWHAHGLPVVEVYRGHRAASLGPQYMALLDYVLASQAWLEDVIRMVAGPGADLMAQWDAAAQVQQDLGLN